MKKSLFLLLFLTIISPLASMEVLSKDKPQLVVPCAIPFYRELDFTVGDWKVYHKSDGKLAGYDRITRTLKGCAIQQSWISLDDHFSSPYVPFRMNGKSLTAFNGTSWVQFWVDNQAGVQILKGGPEKGLFVLRSDQNIAGYQYKMTWEIQKDGTLLNTHERRSVVDNEQGEWQKLYQWVYVKNLNQALFPDDN